MTLTGASAARLYDDHVDAVHAMVTRRVGPEAGPDIVAETFEHALRTWERFDLERGTERLFLFGSASAVLRRHASIENAHLRSIRPGPDQASGITVVDPLVSGHRTPLRRVVDHEANNDLTDGGLHVGEAQNREARDSEVPDTPNPAAALMAAIADLAPDDRDIVLLSLWEACPQGAIAEALDLSVGTVRSALGRIRRELKSATTKADEQNASEKRSRG